MQPYNILIGCDQKYFDDWGITLLESLKKYAPFISLHCHIVNPTKNNVLEGVNITNESINFISKESKISYLQAVRFLVVANNFLLEENVVVIDADTICTKLITEKDFKKLFKEQYVLSHKKDNRWLAGFVTFTNNNFRYDFANYLKRIPIEEWKWGRDQEILKELSVQYNFIQLPLEWMAIGKNKKNSYFLTLKGDQKETDKYLKEYNKYKVQE
jgi:hypothetical protein